MVTLPETEVPVTGEVMVTLGAVWSFLALAELMIILVSFKEVLWFLKN